MIDGMTMKVFKYSTIVKYSNIGRRGYDLKELEGNSLFKVAKMKDTRLKQRRKQFPNTPCKLQNCGQLLV